MARDTEIAELKQQIAEMQAQIAELRAAAPPKPAAPPPKPREDRGVTITQVSSLAPPSSLPTDDEAGLLLDKLRERFPTFCRALSSDIPEAQHRKLFRNSFRFVVQAYRRDSVNPEVDGIWWINEAREFLRSVGGDNDVSWPAICAAVIGAGDILHTGAASFPYAYFGLARGSRSFAYRPIFREILAGERDFLPAVEKGSRATLEYSSPGYETDIPTNMRRAGLL